MYLNNSKFFISRKQKITLPEFWEDLRISELDPDEENSPVVPDTAMVFHD